MAPDRPALLALGRSLLLAIGEDPDREGLLDTPRRFADHWCEFIAPLNATSALDTTFTSVATDQLVTVDGMRVWSMCEHHLLPFWCDIAIGYVATDTILGLSKFARIAHAHAHKLQLQERLVHEIADHIVALTGSEDVAVLGRGSHLCMTMRGVKTEAAMTTSVMRGIFRTKPEARAEFLAMVGR